MKEELVVRLNTEENLITASNPDMAGLYTRFGGDSLNYARESFKKVIKYCIEKNKESTIDEDRILSGEIRALMGQEGPDAPFEIKVYDGNKQFKKNINNERSSVLHLEDLVEPYIEKKDMEGNGELKDYLDIVVRLNPALGR